MLKHVINANLASFKGKENVNGETLSLKPEKSVCIQCTGMQSLHCTMQPARQPVEKLTQAIIWIRCIFSRLSRNDCGVLYVASLASCSQGSREVAGWLEC